MSMTNKFWGKCSLPVAAGCCRGNVEAQKNRKQIGRLCAQPRRIMQTLRTELNISMNYN